jgi:phosphohistidine swiveling domain-containing protein
MTEWLLSGHNTQESTGVAFPVTVTMTESGLDAQINWFLSQLAGDTSDFDHTLKPTEVIQGRLYLNINYYARNMAAVMPFDSESVGAPSGLVEAAVKPPVGRLLRLPSRFRRTYRWAADFYQNVLPKLDHELRDHYWQLQAGPEDPLSLIWPLFEPEFYDRSRNADRAHIVTSLTITALDGVLRQRAPQLLGLFAGQTTATSLIGQRIWELCQTAEACGANVRQMLAAGNADLRAYEALPEAAPLVASVRDFLRDYGHRGFRYEADFETERLVDRPEHILLAVAGQLGESESPEVRAESARRIAQDALERLNPLQRAIWQRVLRWGQKLISWREDSKSNIALRQALYGLAARHLAHHFFPDHPNDVLMFYTLDEFLSFVRSRGGERVGQETLDWRRAELELHQTQPAPPELIWYDPQARHWRPAAEEKKEAEVPALTRLQGIAASAGSRPAEGIAVVTNDPLEAARRLLAMKDPAVLITRLTDPAWSGLFRGLSAVVTELGGVISHAAIVARENGLPAVVGVPNATRLIRDGQRVRVDGTTGVIEASE